ncbi:unnamed protein product [Cladocopium goreaui]|uniref:CUGBP Elav-like family member 1 n=1 Tax=Cladocopium goreaui TaxID=2562237 RepID=A0A9P1DQA9_9DINO|nr:unnamed protein product [Cladocopium goreaui]
MAKRRPAPNSRGTRTGRRSETTRNSSKVAKVAKAKKAPSDAWNFTKVAVDFIEQSTEDANVWPALLTTPTVALHARKMLMAKVGWNCVVFFKNVSYAAANWMMERAAPQGEARPVFAKRIALTALVGPSGPALSPAPRFAAPALPATPRTPSLLEESAAESPVRKVRRRLRFKQGYDAKLELIGESALGSLSLELTASIFSFLDVRTKISAVLVASMGLREVMHQRGTWEPMVIEKSVGRGLLHKLKHKDPLCYFTEERLSARKSFPRGFFEVTTLEIDLMDPERVEAVQSDTEDDAPRPLMALIPDPLDEILKRLKHYFTWVSDLTIRNIEDYRMDYRFVELRCHDLCSFPYVLLCHGATHVPQTYCLRAKRDSVEQIMGWIADYRKPIVSNIYQHFYL